MCQVARVTSVRCGIADIERSVASHGVHDHRQLAPHGDVGFAVAGAFGIAWPPVLTLSLPLKRVISPEAARRKASVAHQHCRLYMRP